VRFCIEPGLLFTQGLILSQGHLYKAVACFLRSIAVYVQSRSKPKFDEPAATSANLQNIAKALRELKSSLDRLSVHPAQVAAGLKQIQNMLVAVMDGALTEQKQWWRRPPRGYIIFFSHFGRLCVEVREFCSEFRAVMVKLQ
jgi:hypothetical protein